MVLKIHKSVNFQIYQLGDITSEYILKGKEVIVPNNAIKICCFKTIQQAIKRYTSLLQVYLKNNNQTVADHENNKNETQFINWKLLSKL